MKSRLSTWMLITALVGAGTLAYGGDDLTSLSYISYLERYATVYPSSGDETLDAQVNMPILAGDRLDTARGARVEVQLADGCILWIDEFTTVDFDAIAMSRDADSRRTVLNIVAGGIAIEIPSTATVEENVRVDSRRGSVLLSRPGLYRLDVERDELHVEAHAGLAELPAGMGSVLLRAGQQAWLEEDEEENDIKRASLDDDFDDFWAWVGERRDPRSGGQTARYVEGRHGSRAAVLDTYGEWVYVSTYSSWAWRPRVGVDWRPYSLGRWYWTPVGWNWVSYEPWGWYPYHYGSWYWDTGYGWVWCWDWVWGPAWVHWMWADGYLGWCPRGYYDWWYWGHNQHHYSGRWPDRWSHAAFDFSGRVRLRDVDPRPWTFVPGDRFGSSHIDRVRVNTERVLRDIGDRGDGIVRSGPLVTRGPGRELPDRGVGDVIRRGAGDRQTPDLGAVLRRDAEGLTRTPGERAILDPSRTVDLVSRTLPGRTVEPPSRGVGGTTRERVEGDGRVRIDPGSPGVPTGRESPGRTIPSRDLNRVAPGTPVQPPAGGTTTERSVQRPDGGTGRTVPSERPGARTDSGRGSPSGSTGSGRSEPVSRPDPGTTRPDPPARSDPPPRADPPPRSDPPARPDPPERPDPPVRQNRQVSERSYDLPDRSAYRTQDATRSRGQGRDQVTFRARTQPGPETSRTYGRSTTVSPGSGGSRVGSSSRQVSSSPSRSRSDGSSSMQSWSGGSRSSSRSQASGSGRSTSQSSSSTRAWSGSSRGSSSAGRSYSSSGSSSSRSSAGSSSSRSSAGSSSSRSSAGSSSSRSSGGNSSSRSSGGSSSSTSRSSSGSSRSSQGSSSSSRHR